jgi:hypothetical protein
MLSSLQDGQEIWVRCSTSFCGNSGFLIFTVYLQMNGQDGSAAAGASCTAAPGWLAGVEPSARSGGHFPRGLHLWKTGILTEVLAGRQRGWVWDGDEEATTRNVGKVAGSMGCTSGFGSSSGGGDGVFTSATTSRARPGRGEMLRR